MTWHYTPELGDKIAELMEDGYSMRQVSAMDGFPSRSVMLKWLKTIEDFKAKCACARTIQGEMAIDEMKEITDKVMTGEITPDVARVVLSNMQWRAPKLEPKYREKSEVELNSQYGFNQLSDEQLASQLKGLLTVAGVPITSKGASEAESGEQA